MKKALFITSLILLLFCNINAQTQSEMNQSAKEKYQLADQELNNIYNLILFEYKNDSTFIDKLTISQNLWMKFRDAELEMKFPEPSKKINYGSIYPICAYIYLEQITIERIKKLKEWLYTISNVEGCSGSIKYRELPQTDITFENIENYEYHRIFNSFKILKEINSQEIFVRILTIGNLPGSAEFENLEITNDLLFAVSEIDEIPKQNLFRVNNLYHPKIESIDFSDSSKPIIKISFGNSENRQSIIFILSINELKIVE